MGHAGFEESDVFTNVKYVKTPAEIKTAMEKRIAWLSAKINERTDRIKVIREQYHIDDAALVAIMISRDSNRHQQFYTVPSNSNKPVKSPTGDTILVPGGSIENICAEQKWIENEKTELATLTLMAKHMDMTEKNYEVSLSDLQRFEFP